MDQSSERAKICSACGVDCAHQRRVRDASGRYMCGSCYDDRLARQADPEPIGLGVGALDDIGYDIEPAAEGIASMATCPGCGRPLEAGAVVCVGCGYNKQSGTMIKARVLEHHEDEVLAAAQRDRRARSAAAAAAAYRTPLIMFVVGMIGMLGIYGSQGGVWAAFAYGAFFIVSLVIGLLVYWVCSVLWIGFNESLLLSLVLLAGIYSISDLAQVVLGFVPIPFLPWLISIGIYIHLLTEMLDIELFDAVILAFVTFIVKWIAVITIMAVVLSAFGL